MGRNAANGDAHGNSANAAWYSVPGLVSDIGPEHGKRATWISASGDETFIKLDENLVNEEQLYRSTVLSSERHFGKYIGRYG